jgi:hypothetical protein
MKKLIIGVVALLGFALIQPAQAEDQKVLAIIDSAIDSSKFPQVIYEACFTQNSSCPNKTGSMEGVGSARSTSNAGVTSWPASISNQTYHGHNMVQGALSINPNTKIVFVRIGDVTAQGNSLNQPKSLSDAIKWVSDNAQKYSIDALSISQSGTSANNLNSCKNDKIVIDAVAYLGSQNVPTFAATGNNKFTDKVGFPSCVEGVIGVGSLGSTAKVKTADTYNQFAAVTNRGPGLDVVAQGNTSIVRYNGSLAETSDTSGATVIAASLYLNNKVYFSFNSFVLTLKNVLGYPYISK